MLVQVMKEIEECVKAFGPHAGNQIGEILDKLPVLEWANLTITNKTSIDVHRTCLLVGAFGVFDCSGLRLVGLA